MKEIDSIISAMMKECIKRESISCPHCTKKIGLKTFIEEVRTIGRQEVEKEHSNNFKLIEEKRRKEDREYIRKYIHDIGCNVHDSLNSDNDDFNSGMSEAVILFENLMKEHIDSIYCEYCGKAKDSPNYAYHVCTRKTDSEDSVTKKQSGLRSENNLQTIEKRNDEIEISEDGLNGNTPSPADIKQSGVRT